MFRIYVHPDVYDELESARKWYADKSAELGNDFLDEIDFAMDAIQAAPEAWPPFSWVAGTRRFLVHRFPFGVFYRLSIETVQILAVGHLHRKPGYWKSRM
ncbi:MAG: type II toxin-antitoxin system RelE/ParE family toxin [Chitinivibrionales bacterium]|nr:type II toxin-antitoxin system RelE/ParE family toxin [Chitinivibrionales bacterium]